MESSECGRVSDECLPKHSGFMQGRFTIGTRRLLITYEAIIFRKVTHEGAKAAIDTALGQA